MNLMESALSWFEIPVDDIKRAQRFYEQIFMIEMQKMTVGTGLKMAIFPVAANGVGGALCEHVEFYRPTHDGTLVYLNGNPDLQTVLDRVKAHGGHVIKGKTRISPDYGYMAIFEDSEGNRVALRSMN